MVTMDEHFTFETGNDKNQAAFKNQPSTTQEAGVIKVRITCPECGRGYRISDQKLPKKTIRISCKSCGAKFPVDPVHNHPKPPTGATSQGKIKEKPTSSGPDPGSGNPPEDSGIIEIECPECGKQYSIPRKRLPSGPVKMKCKRCQASISVNTGPEKKSQSEIVCKKCGHRYTLEKKDPEREAACPKCGLLFSKGDEYIEKKKKEPLEQEPVAENGDIATDTDTKKTSKNNLLLMIALFLVIAFSFGYTIKFMMGFYSGRSDTEKGFRVPRGKPGATFRNKIGMKFIYIPGGDFMMGSPEEAQGRRDDEILHKVTIESGFFIQTTETTWRQWKKLMGEGTFSSEFPDCDEDCPVVNVSWEDVNGFITRLNNLEQSSFYRLPTEAEWEYACRAGNQGPFSIDPELDFLDDFAWYADNSEKTPHPVGKLKPNNWKLYDMHGNVAEWCRDWYSRYQGQAVSDPWGPTMGKYRVIRGGGWRDEARFLRSAHRGYMKPTDVSSDVGFRVVFRTN